LKSLPPGGGRGAHWSAFELPASMTSECNCKRHNARLEYWASAHPLPRGGTDVTGSESYLKQH